MQICKEDFETFEGLDHAAYDEYRWQLLFDASGIEHYVVKH